MVESSAISMEISPSTTNTELQTEQLDLDLYEPSYSGHLKSGSGFHGTEDRYFLPPLPPQNSGLSFSSNYENTLAGTGLIINDSFGYSGWESTDFWAENRHFLPTLPTLDSSFSTNAGIAKAGSSRDKNYLVFNKRFSNYSLNVSHPETERPFNSSPISLADSSANSTLAPLFPPPADFQMTRKTNLSMQNSRICGVPGFCEGNAYDSCFNTSISKCDECSKFGSRFFLSFVTCLGLAILIGNLIILAVVWKRHKSRKASKMDACRCSLAIADLLTSECIKSS